MVGKVLSLSALLVGGAACAQEELHDESNLPAPDFEAFRCRVQPILLKKCAFAACHGDEARRLRFFAPHRLRLAGSEVGPLSRREVRANYDATRGFLQSNAEDAWLLLKPLDSSDGGYFHVGEEMFGGGDVFLSTRDPDYQTIAAWVDGELTLAPSCREELVR